MEETAEQDSPWTTNSCSQQLVCILATDNQIGQLCPLNSFGVETLGWGKELTKDYQGTSPSNRDLRRVPLGHDIDTFIWSIEFYTFAVCKFMRTLILRYFERAFRNDSNY